MMYAMPMYFVPLWIFCLVFAAATALMEIQIEGGNGWARCLPSWRYAPRWMKMFLNGKDITGYHVYLNLHLITLFHLPILLSGWSWMMEWTILSMLFSCMVCEDFLWFVLNPHFGYDSFKQGKIAWYTHWMGPVPVDYYLWLGISLFFAMLRGTEPDSVGNDGLSAMPFMYQQLVGWSVGLLMTIAILSLIIVACKPYIARFLAKDMPGHPGHPGACDLCPRK